jgi:hypothetical protein
MAFLSKEQILAAQDLPTEVVPVPEWGGDVMVQGLTGTERDAFEASLTIQKGKSTQWNLQNTRAKLVQKSIVNPDTKGRMFSEAEIGVLGRKSAVALERVFDVARRLSGLTEQDVEELTKNSESETNDDSGSVSL